MQGALHGCSSIKPRDESLQSFSTAKLGEPNNQVTEPYSSAQTLHARTAEDWPFAAQRVGGPETPSSWALVCRSLWGYVGPCFPGKDHVAS